MEVRFRDRVDAGRALANALRGYHDEPVVVLGLPRGGMPVAFEVARSMAAPLDVIVVRKLGVPFQPELAMGAIGENGVRVSNPVIIAQCHVNEVEFVNSSNVERTELERRLERFRDVRQFEPLHGKTAIVVDDGLATGATALAACKVARAHGAAKVVLAVPVGPETISDELKAEVDDYVCLFTPKEFIAIGQFYEDFTQVSEDEVVRLLRNSRAPADVDVVVAASARGLPGHLNVPEGAIGLVIFAHGSGSSRHSPRNRFVADILNRAGLATLLFDLLSPAEENDRKNVFDVELLSNRLAAATEWARGHHAVSQLPIGYFGASTGAAAALGAAARPGNDIGAIVSRGGRPDLAGSVLPNVTSPCLFIVGGRDKEVYELNKDAQSRLRCLSRLEVVPGASHLFEEPGTLRQAAQLARDWFTTHLAQAHHYAVG